MMTPRRMLGLAVADRSITAVEVGVVHGRRKVLHAAEFPLPEGDASPDPAVLAKALRQFLRQSRFSTSRCVIGIGARWLVAKEKSLPPTAADLLAGVLSIATEREFASDPKDLVFDYCGPVDSPQGHAVLLVAAPRRNTDFLLATAQAAGLTVAALTSSTLALASATGGPPAPRRLVLYLSPAAAELIVQSDGGFRLLRRLPISPAAAATGSSAADGWLDDLAGELGRIVALLPGAKAPQPSPDLLIWNASGLPAAALGTLGKRLSLEARLCAVSSDLGIADGPATGAGEFAAAAALALAGFNGRRLAVDFLHSRLNPRKKVALRKKVAWGVGVAAALAVACLALLLIWQKDKQEVQDLQNQLGGMKESLAAAKDVVARAAFARGWYDRRPKHLDCLRELTLAFPAEGRIWTTSLAISEDMRVLISGKASDGGAVLEVVDRLRGNKNFSDVKHLYTREVGSGTTEVSFAISLTFAKADGS